MSGESLLPRVSFGAAEDFTSVDRLVSVTLGVTLEMLFTSEGFVAVFALVHPLYLYSSSIHLHVLLRSVKCHNLKQK